MHCRCKFNPRIGDYPPITHVAIRFNGLVYALPAPNRHCNVVSFISELNGNCYVDSLDNDQGFLNEFGVYLTRKQAMVNAKLNDQLIRPIVSQFGLYSENLC